MDFGTADDTAEAGTDYTAESGTLTFLPGDPLTQNVTVAVNGDTTDEGVDEAFTLDLSNAVGAPIALGIFHLLERYPAYSNLGWIAESTPIEQFLVAMAVVFLLASGLASPSFTAWHTRGDMPW